ncbi:MAG: patatin-like phospholipase family protein [Candidatus Nitrosocaldus sp.]|nr:patatin-like phospholipase family protein [Candidatus Nitrosocaldus sp.]MDW7999705.1 patatin-like phospholipase family protein [Candidatus Nitrosocaldus sp.]
MVRRRNRQVEKVLVLQGGGSLGAFACGVFKALRRLGIVFDVVAGTSIGAVNAAIIAGSRSDEPDKALEEFWLEVAESSYEIIPELLIPVYSTEGMQFKRISSGALNSMLFGVPKVFVPRWMQSLYDYGMGGIYRWGNWTYLYDHSVMKDTLSRYVDFTRLRPGGGGTRLIITAVNVLTAEHLIFDSARMQIEAKHVLASTAASQYGFPWVEVGDGVFAWDGALISNTPLREVLIASPRSDKEVYLVENYPQVRSNLPRNIIEVVDRSRDITFSDKTSHDIEVFNRITRLIDLVELLYSRLMERGEGIPSDVIDAYRDLIESHGAEVLVVHKISRRELDTPYLLKNADFSRRTIRDLIKQGEDVAYEQLQKAK